MKAWIQSCCLAGGVWLAVSPAMGAVIPRDSALFTHRYEATDAEGLPEDTGDYTLGGASPLNSNVSLGGSILSYDTMTVPGQNGTQWWESQTWTAERDPAVGWTAEVSVQVIDSEIVLPGTPPGFGPFALTIGDGSDWGVLFIRENDVTYGDHSFSSIVTIPTDDNTDGLHVFRIAKDAGSSDVQIWRDGVPIGVDIPTPTTRVFDILWWGDGSSNINGQAHIDYVRWDAGGAFAPPIPEPATAGVLIAGGLALLRRRCA